MGQSEKSFRRALDSTPNSSDTRESYAGWFLLALGRPQDAIQQLRIAEKNDPLSSDLQDSLAFTLIALGRYDEAAEHCRKMREDLRQES